MGVRRIWTDEKMCGVCFWGGVVIEGWIGLDGVYVNFVFLNVNVRFLLT